MNSVKEYKCPNCNAPLEFNPPTQNWKCDYCAAEFKLEEIDTVHNEEASEQDMQELDSYKCGSCGAELIADATTSATFCLYCKSPTIIKTRFSGRFKPKSVIPFRLVSDEAKEIYREWISKKLFTPKEFKQKEEIDKVTGIYAPFWLFDCRADGMISGEATRVTSWRKGDYRYTNTKYYLVTRRGVAQYNRIPVDASKKLDDNFMFMAEPYHYDDLKEFSMKYMSGFMAERYDVESDEAKPTMEARAKKYMEDRLRSTVSGYSSFSIRDKNVALSKVDASYAMLPIYLLINKFKGKDHIFIINGQTGKVVGDTPISRLRQFVFAIIVFVVVWLICVFGGALIV
ncbi:MAG: DNA helicase PriA [Clostridiaceae bacterium]|jgi:DNA-directed RNA polymerase subunit RPC12/RpoP|nr:DNA helicase PriA [Clostridiaceae bacterium]